MIFARLYRIFFGTVRRQLIVNVALVHAVMMSLFIHDLTQRQRTMLLDRQVDQAKALSNSLATSAAGWIAADDVSGLQELVDAQNQYPELLFAMLTDNDGKILAHTDASKLGLYLQDLPETHQAMVISRTSALVDVAVPAELAETPVGWARVGVGQRVARHEVERVVRNGTLYALAAILIGSFFAWLLGRAVTQRLNAIQSTFEEIRSGNTQARAQIRGADEVAVMAGELNRVLDTLSERGDALEMLNDRLQHELAEKELAEAALRRSSDEIQDLYNHAPCGYHSLNKEGLFVRVNDTELQWLGYARDEFVGKKKFADLLHPRNQGKFLEHFERLKTQGWIRDAEFELMRKDGSSLPVLLSATAVYDESGKFVMSRATAYDISDRLKAERMRRLLSAIVDSSDDAIISKTLDGTILSWNEGARRMYGYSADEIIGKPVSLLLPPDRTDEVPSLLEQVRRDAGKRNFETQRICKDGRRIFVSLTVSPVHDSNGNVIGASTIARDITDKRRAEDEIRALNATLEQRVQERTWALDRANQELEAFSYSVSHDLRAPLRAINGFSRILLEDYAHELSADAARFLQIIRDNTVQMGHLVDDLLAFSRFGRQALNKQSLSPEQIIAPIVNQMRQEAGDRHIEVHINPLPRCRADPALLTQVWTNLISNAFKYTRPRDPAVIEIGSLPGRTGNEVSYYIRDNGVGFDMQYASRLFGVFQRLHRQEEFEGTGVGLAIVQRIIVRHGGRVWAEAKPDKGATFHISLERG